MVKLKIFFVVFVPTFVNKTEASSLTQKWASFEALEPPLPEKNQNHKPHSPELFYL
jgi:hypothetical protein